jgi:hypothetical protein
VRRDAVDDAELGRTRARLVREVDALRRDVHGALELDHGHALPEHAHQRLEPLVVRMVHPERDDTTRL